VTFEKYQAEIVRHKRLLVYASSPDCSVCKVLKPKVLKAAGLHNWELLDINLEKSPEVAGQLLLFSVPVILLYTDGQEFRRYARNLSLDELEFFLEEYSPDKN
jgi:thioredoxin 1